MLGLGWQGGAAVKSSACAVANPPTRVNDER